MADEPKKDVQTSEEMAAELAVKVSDELVETQTKEADAQATLEKATTDRLEKTFVTGEKLELPEPALKEDDSTPEGEPAEESDDKDGPTAAEKKEEAKLEAEAKAKEGEKKDGESTEKVDDKAKDGDANKGGDKKKDIPPLSDAYYRAAIHRGWKPEEIDEMYEANPELTVRTLGNIYEAVNRTSKEFAALGRAAKEAVAPKTDVQPAPEAEAKPEFKGIDIEKLRKEYPDDSVVDLVKAVQDQSKALFDEVQELKVVRPALTSSQPSDVNTQQVRAVEQEAAAIEQQIETFFKADELKGYEDFYGTLPKDATDWSKLTPGQKMNRWTVIEMMDQMIVGARTLGRELKIDETLNLAHLSVTEPIREKVIREDIQAKVVKRNSSLTLKPSGTAQSGDAKPQTKQELESVTTERLNKVFN